MILEQICFTIKIGAAVLVFAGCTGVGFYQSGLVSQRIREDREFYRIMTLLYGEIEYAATPLPQALKKIAARSGQTFKLFFETVAGQLENAGEKTLREIWLAQVQYCFADSAMGAAEREILLDFGKNMGYGDKKMQLSTIALYMDNLETILKGLEENAASKKKLYRCIGIFAGILSVVLLV